MTPLTAFSTFYPIKKARPDDLACLFDFTIDSNEDSTNEYIYESFIKAKEIHRLS